MFAFPLQYVLAFQNDGVPCNGHVAEFRPQLDRAYNHMYIYSNIAKYTQVGEALVPLLRNVSISKALKFGEKWYLFPKIQCILKLTNHNLIRLK